MRSLSLPQRDEYFTRVWRVVKTIPPGQVVSYGQVAGWLKPPMDIAEDEYKSFGAMWVGQALKSCPEGVPWQRVLNSQGKISLPGASGARQRKLLEAEGVEFDAKDRVSLREFGWDGVVK
jgi:methylated-DNA-protein-cysteine methyltransferase related protein